jgi:hypothetical protein
MTVKQISISLENVPGKFLDISEYLGSEGVNIRAISVADTRKPLMCCAVTATRSRRQMSWPWRYPTIPAG